MVRNSILPSHHVGSTDRTQVTKLSARSFPVEPSWGGILKHGFSIALEDALETPSVDQANLKHRDLPASAAQRLGLKSCTITTQFCGVILTDLLFGFFFSWLFYFFKTHELFWSPGQTPTHHVAQARLELMAIPQPQSPKCLDDCHIPHTTPNDHHLFDGDADKDLMRGAPLSFNPSFLKGETTSL